MIVQSMNINEILRQVESDIHSSQFRNKHDSMLRLFVKTMRLRQDYPVTMNMHWTHPVSKNRWILSMRAYTPRQKRDPHWLMYCYFDLANGKYVIAPTVSTKHHQVWALHPPHFFKRYRERILENSTMTPMQVIETFLERNDSMVQQPDRIGGYNRYAFMSTEKRDFSGKIHDGNIFGQCFDTLAYGRVFVIKTVVSDSMLFRSQRKIFEEMNEKLEIMRDDHYFTK